MKTPFAAEARLTAVNVYLRELRRYPPLPIAEEAELARAALAGDVAARERLVSSNLRFVVTVAKKYQGRGLPLEDLICEGNKGILRALQRYDPERGLRFVSYAVHWIVAMIQLALKAAPLVRNPGADPAKARAIHLADNRLSHELSTLPTAAEIAQLTGMDERVVEETLLLGDVVSLDDPHPENSLTRLDALPAAQRPERDPADVYAALQKSIKRYVSSLQEMEAAVVTLRFGLGGEPPMTLEKIGQRLGRTRAGIQYIERKALDKLRRSQLRRAVARISDPESGSTRQTRSRPRKAAKAVEITIAVARPDISESALPRSAGWLPPVRRATAPGDVRKVRDVVIERANATSLKLIAAEMDVPEHELLHFLKGIRLPTMYAGRLRAWYERIVPPEEREETPATHARNEGVRAPDEAPAELTATVPSAPRRGATLATSEAAWFDEIRAYAVDRVASLSLRYVAAEIGMGKRALAAFLAGGVPSELHWRSMRRWYTSPPPEPPASVYGYRRTLPVPVSTLRDFFRVEVQQTSLRRTAREAGIGHSSLDNFISKPEVEPQYKTLHILGSYYLRRRKDSQAADGDTPAPQPREPGAGALPLDNERPEVSAATLETTFQKAHRDHIAASTGLA